MEKRKEREHQMAAIRLSDTVWLFTTGSLLGVLIEGLFCLIRYGHWETHVVSMLGPFCVIYGFGAVGFYTAGMLLQDRHTAFRFLIYAFIGTFVELICGWLLEHWLHMYAWDYSGNMLNYHGYICFSMTAVWGCSGLLFDKLIPRLHTFFGMFQGKAASIIAVVVAVIMLSDLVFTLSCINRWARRHRGLNARSKMEVIMDERYDDDYMQQRFCEWNFFDEKKTDR